MRIYATLIVNNDKTILPTTTYSNMCIIHKHIHVEIYYDNLHSNTTFICQLVIIPRFLVCRGESWSFSNPLTPCLLPTSSGVDGVLLLAPDPITHQFMHTPVQYKKDSVSDTYEYTTEKVLHI